MLTTKVYFWLSCASLGVLVLFATVVPLPLTGRGFVSIVLASTTHFLGIAAAVAPIVGVSLLVYGLCMPSRRRDKFLFAGILCDIAIVILVLLTILSPGDRL